MFFINLKQNVNGFLLCVSWLCLLGPLPSVANSSQYFSAGLSKNYGPWKQIFPYTHRAFFETFCVLIIGRRFLQQQALYIGRPFWVIGWKFRLLGTLPLPPPPPTPHSSPQPIQYVTVLLLIHICFRQAESVATLPPFSPIEGQKWFDQISSQWESQKNRFALTYFGKIQFLPPCIWNIPFMSTASG